jgi:hypothetical protein
VLLKSGGKTKLCHEDLVNYEIGQPRSYMMACNTKNNKGCGQNSNDLVAFPAGRLGVLQAFTGMRLLWVPVFAHERVGVLFLIKIAEGVVDFTMLTLIRTNYIVLA